MPPDITAREFVKEMSYTMCNHKVAAGARALGDDDDSDDEVNEGDGDADSLDAGHQSEDDEDLFA